MAGASLGRDGPKPAMARGRRCGGIKHFMETSWTLTRHDEGPWDSNITPELKQTVIDGVAREAAGRSVDQLAQDENRVIVGLLKLRGLDSKDSAAAAKTGKPKPTTQRAPAGANA